MGIRDSWMVVNDEQLSGTCQPCGQVAACSIIVPSLALRGTNSGKNIVGSALESLLEHMQLLIQFGQLLAFATDLAHGMQNRCVVPATEQFADFR